MQRNALKNCFRAALTYATVLSTLKISELQCRVFWNYTALPHRPFHANYLTMKHKGNPVTCLTISNISKKR